MVPQKDYVKLVVFVPESHAEKVRSVLAENGAGKLGAYDSCSFSVRGMGRFRPLKGSKPAIGLVGVVEEVPEERVEVICAREGVDVLVAAVRAVHPYEEPAIEIYSLELP